MHMVFVQSLSRGQEGHLLSEIPAFLPVSGEERGVPKKVSNEMAITSRWIGVDTQGLRTARLSATKGSRKYMPGTSFCLQRILAFSNGKAVKGAKGELVVGTHTSITAGCCEMPYESGLYQHIIDLVPLLPNFFVNMAG
jgi:hypothetical protein